MSDKGPKKPFMLMCRVENENGSGAWLMVEVDNKDDGDATARGLKAQVGDDLGHMRCELVPNNEAGITKWAKGSNKRKQAREQFLRQREQQ
jgi:hypothetical protein